MARSLSPTLTAEQNNLHRTPAGKVTVERFLPEWSAHISGLTGGETEEFAHGHVAAVAVDGNGAGEDILLRARSGSYSNRGGAANPQDGHLYVSVLMGSDLEDPTAWDDDAKWSDSGITGLMYPAWTANSGAEHGGSIAAAIWDDGGTLKGRVFYTKANGDLAYVDVTLSTGAVSGETVIASVGTGAQLASMQIGACTYDEVFVLLNQLVEAGLAGWHQDVYGSFVRRYYYSGGWQTDDSFFYHTHAEAGLVRDGPDEGDDFGDTSCDGITAQWGKRPCGGLAVCDIDDDTVLVSLGLTFWRKWGYDTHAQGLMSFIYHRDSGWWEVGPEAGRADFNEARRLDFDLFARGYQVEGSNFMTWSRYVEPADLVQTEGAETMPRLEEAVFARVSADGKYLTQLQHLGSPDQLTAAALAAINHDGGKRLYALGWRAVWESPLAAAVCSVDEAQDMEMYCSGFGTIQDNRMGMGIDMDLEDPSILTAAGTVVRSGSLTRAYYGIPGELVQIAQGYLDLTTPILQAGEDFSEGAQLNGRGDKLLLDVKAESIEDMLPQNVMEVPPDEPIKHVDLHRGYWQVVEMEWPNLFFSGTFGDLNGEKAYRLRSFPYAQTGGEGGVGDPGQVLNSRQQHKGSWFKDISWLAMLPMVDGSIEASVRFGDVNNEGNFSFEAEDGNQVYTTINRSNGVITTIEWRTEGFGGPIFNTVAQSAVMAGLLCHAPEVGKKYAFVWEYNSDFSTSSHTDDTWTAENFDRADYSTHGTGANRLYLIVSDYDGSDWVHKSVAGITATGLTPGQPADLKMVVLGGTIYCFYRLHSTGTPNQWRFAFSHKAGRFGAGRFGLVGRGHAGIQWDVLYPGRDLIAKCDNYVDFWDIKLSDAVQDLTLEDHLGRYCWRGFTETDFRSEVEEASRTVNAAASHSYGNVAANLTIDFKVSIPANGNEAGVFVRGVSSGSPTDDCIKIGLVAHGTANSAGNEVNYYVVKRLFASGVETASARAYSPIPIQLGPGTPVPVRVTVRGTLYSVWIAGNYAGHFRDETELGFYYGLYAEGGNADFSEIHVPELYEVPKNALLEPGSSMWDGMQRVLGQRRVKGMFLWDGTLRFSYFITHDSGPSFEETIWQNEHKKNERFYSIVKVKGTDTEALFTSQTLLARGRRYYPVINPEIQYREFAYREAQAIATEAAERQAEATFRGLPDLRVEAEDEIGIVVSRQGISGDYLVDDVSLSFTFGDEPDSVMTVSTRQKVTL